MLLDSFNCGPCILSSIRDELMPSLYDFLMNYGEELREEEFIQT